MDVHVFYAWIYSEATLKDIHDAYLLIKIH